jgi:hypothetical protein
LEREYSPGVVFSSIFLSC